MTKTLVERDRSTIWHPYEQYGSPPPIAITKASGCSLFTEDGKEIVDAISSWWVSIHGHAHPKITKAITAQLESFHHVIFSGFTHEPAVDLAEKLLSVLPKNQSKIFYSDNGSTAVEVAIKLCIQYWSNLGTPKQRVIALEGSYHGDTFGAMACSERGYFVAPFEKLLFETTFIPSPADNPDRTIECLKAEIAKGDVACIIFEPLVQGAGGMKMYDCAVLEEMMRLCKSSDVLTIADEVMTGFGRLGSWFAVSPLVVMPDVLCLSKGLTGGTLPMGVTSCTEELFSAFKHSDRSKTFFHGHSFTGNPIAAAAAVASFEIMSESSTWESISRISQRQSAFVSTLTNHPNVINARSKGTLAAFDLKTKESTSYLNPIKERFLGFCIERGVFVRPLGNIVYIMPPFVMSDETLLGVYEVVLEAIEEVV